jgi:adenosine deaminase
VQYVELMLTLMPARDRQTLAKTIEGETDLATMLDTLKRNGLDRAVEEARRRVVDLIERVNAALDCGSERVKAGCGVSYRFIAQVSRNNPIEEVFVQTAAAAALIRAGHGSWRSIFVGPGPSVRADYRAHMKIIEFLARMCQSRCMPVSCGGLVPPEDRPSHSARQ